MYLSRQFGIHRLLSLQHAANSGSTFHIARPEVQGAIGLKDVVNKLDSSPVEHIVKVTEDEPLLGGQCRCRSGLSD
jgi:hypothetical protein